MVQTSTAICSNELELLASCPLTLRKDSLGSVAPAVRDVVTHKPSVLYAFSSAELNFIIWVCIAYHNCSQFVNNRIVEVAYIFGIYACLKLTNKKKNRGFLFVQATKPSYMESLIEKWFETTQLNYGQIVSLCNN